MVVANCSLVCEMIVRPLGLSVRCCRLYSNTQTQHIYYCYIVYHTRRRPTLISCSSGVVNMTRYINGGKALFVSQNVRARHKTQKHTATFTDWYLNSLRTRSFLEHHVQLSKEAHVPATFNLHHRKSSLVFSSLHVHPSHSNHHLQRWSFKLLAAHSHEPRLLVRKRNLLLARKPSVFETLQKPAHC